MAEPRWGALVMAYGTPRSLDEVEAYYTHIRHGRPPTPELLQQLIARYEAIGGTSPLNEITQAEADGIQARLHALRPEVYQVYLGMKHAHPFIGDAIRQMADDGIRRAVTLVLAPHYASMSVGAYQAAAADAAAPLGVALCHIDHWYDVPAFLDLLADRVQEALQRFPAPERVHVVFTAHSLPQRILAAGDPYPEQLRATGQAVGERLGLRDVSFGWQSAGRTPEPWLGPDILEILRSLAAAGKRDVLICPAGFVSDHLEVLYDIDIECQALARDLGMHLERTASLNADPRFLDILAAQIDRRARAEEAHA
ncbi:MAG: ferrochelatase [Alicyclobacillus sp.]|nr:ferrochelatase [Alicyclobacillus sp.]